MLYLLDANVLITADNQYYPIDRVPEFWGWLLHHAERGNIKMPIEIIDEVKPGNRKDNQLYEWITDSDHYEALKLDEVPEVSIIERVTHQGYAPDLTDDELEEIGRDPFLIAAGLILPDRCVVTTEVPKPSKTRQNRKIPDVCLDLGVKCINPFELNNALGFTTSWKA